MRRISFFSIIALVTLLCISCSGKKQQNSVDTNLRQTIVEEINSMRAHLPMPIPNTPIRIEDVSVKENIVIFVASLPKDLWEDSFSFGAEVANSDKNVARMLSNVNLNQVDKFIEAGLGLKYIYKDSENNEALMTIEADCSRLKRVKDGVLSGEIKAYTSLEIFQMEIDKYEFPCEIEEGVWLTDAYIRGNTVYYIANLESDITSDDMTPEDLKDFKDGILEGLNESMIRMHKNEMAQKGIRIIYVYKNNDGDEFARIDISSDDL